MAKVEDIWIIEVELTRHYIRSRVHRVGEPVSLSWAKVPVDDYLVEPVDFFPSKPNEEMLGFVEELFPPGEVNPWAPIEWIGETRVPHPEFHGDPKLYLDYLQGRLKVELEPAPPVLPGYFELTDFLVFLQAERRRPVRASIDFRQTAFRVICVVEVVEWEDKPSANVEADYKSTASQTAPIVDFITLEFEPSTNDESPPASLPHLNRNDFSIDGLHLGMPSESVAQVWSQVKHIDDVYYTAGEVSLLIGSQLTIGTEVFDSSHKSELVKSALLAAGFQQFVGPTLDLEISESRQLIFNSSELSIVVHFTVKEGAKYILCDPHHKFKPGCEFDWLGEAPTIGGLRPGLSEEKFLDILQRDSRAYVLCQTEQDFSTPSIDKGVRILVKDGVCIGIQGETLEQGGRLLLASQYSLPQEHSIDGIRRVLDLDLECAFLISDVGAVKKLQYPDLDLEIQITEDGRRTFILRSIPLPFQVLDLPRPS